MKYIVKGRRNCGKFELTFGIFIYQSKCLTFKHLHFQIDKKVKRHKRSSSLGTTELKEKLRRSLQREKKQSPSPVSIYQHRSDEQFFTRSHHEFTLGELFIAQHLMQYPLQTVHGGLHNIRDVLYRNSEQCYINPSLPVFGLARTRSLDCLSELENLTINPSPLVSVFFLLFVCFLISTYITFYSFDCK